MAIAHGFTFFSTPTAHLEFYRACSCYLDKLASSVALQNACSVRDNIRSHHMHFDMSSCLFPCECHSYNGRCFAKSFHFQDADGGLKLCFTSCLAQSGSISRRTPKQLVRSLGRLAVAVIVQKLVSLRSSALNAGHFTSTARMFYALFTRKTVTMSGAAFFT